MASKRRGIRWQEEQKCLVKLELSHKWTTHTGTCNQGRENAGLQRHCRPPSASWSVSHKIAYTLIEKRLLQTLLKLTYRFTQ
jgi:hypothetical protein